MSTPTAIEIVRIYLDAQAKVSEAIPPCATEIKITTALAAVLRDAERFKALERAHDGLAPQAWCNVFLGEWNTMDGTLSELADRLKEGV